MLLPYKYKYAELRFGRFSLPLQLPLRDRSFHFQSLESRSGFKMLSRETEKFLITGIRMGNFFGILPFSWDKTGECLVPNSGRKLILNKITALLCLTFSAWFFGGGWLYRVSPLSRDEYIPEGFSYGVSTINIRLQRDRET